MKNKDVILTDMQFADRAYWSIKSAHNTLEKEAAGNMHIANAIHAKTEPEPGNDMEQETDVESETITDTLE